MSGGKNKPSGSTTTVQTDEPWEEQKPYLQDVMGLASNLYKGYTPSYYPYDTYAKPSDDQIAGLDYLKNASYADTTGTTANNFSNRLLNGEYFNTNPATAALQGFQTHNLGTAAPGQGTLSWFSANNPAADSPGKTALNNVANTDPWGQAGYAGLAHFTQNPTTNAATGSLGNIANQNIARDSGAADTLGWYSKNQPTSPGSDSLRAVSGYHAGQNGTYNQLGDFARNGAANPGAAAYQSYASGDRLAAGNPYMDALAQSVMAKVVPGIQAGFINSGTLSSPEAARASAAGAASAISPFMFQQYQNEQENQLRAADALSNQSLQARNLQQQAATDQLGFEDALLGRKTQAGHALNDQALQARNLAQDAATSFADTLVRGGQLQTQAADILGTQGLQSRTLQQQAASDLSDYENTLRGQRADVGKTLGDQYLTGADLQKDAATTLGTQALAGRELQQNASDSLNSGYDSTLSNMLKGLAVAPQTQDTAYKPWQNLYDVGATRQNLDQAYIDDQLAEWNWMQNLPYDKLNHYIGAVTGDYGGTSTRTDPYYINRTGNALSGALGGASAGASLFGPTGGLIGGGLGLISSFF